MTGLCPVDFVSSHDLDTPTIGWKAQLDVFLLCFEKVSNRAFVWRQRGIELNIVEMNIYFKLIFYCNVEQLNYNSLLK